MAAGEYIARMDADDISLPERLEIQTKFMDANPEVGAAGTWAKVMGGGKKYIKTPSDFEKIKALSVFKNIIIHPSVIMRKKMFDRSGLRYDENLKYSQDYELWTRAIKYFPIANIKKFLLLYRTHGESVSRGRAEAQAANSGKTKIRQLENLKIVPTEEEKEIHLNLYNPWRRQNAFFLGKKEKWLLKLAAANAQTRYCGEKTFSQTAGAQWLAACSVNADYDFEIFKMFWRSPLRKKIDWSDIENLKILARFFAKCLLPVKKAS